MKTVALTMLMATAMAAETVQKIWKADGTSWWIKYDDSTKMLRFEADVPKGGELWLAFGDASVDTVDMAVFAATGSTGTITDSYGKWTTMRPDILKGFKNMDP